MVNKKAPARKKAGKKKASRRPTTTKAARRPTTPRQKQARKHGNAKTFLPTVGNETSAENIKLLERRRQMVELRLAGYSHRQIAEAIGCSHTVVIHNIQAALVDLETDTAEMAEVLKAEQNEQLDRLLAGAWSRATRGDDKAIASVLAIMARKARINGIDAPQKIAPTDPTGARQYDPHQLDDEQRAARIEAILERARTRRDRRIIDVQPDGSTTRTK